jgi:TonB family protein
MKTQKTNLRNYTIPVLALSLLLFFSCGKNSKTDQIPGDPGQTAVDGKIDGAYSKVDVMPEFPGTDTALLNFIARNTKYPEEAKLNGIQGKVITRFMVKEDGRVANVSILKSDNSLFNEESIRVVSSLPKFSPGLLNGEAVPVWFMIPIQFNLR